MRACTMKDAPSYFDYWANGNTGERCARHYAAQFGGIPMRMSFSAQFKKLNDGHIYVLGCKSSWAYPANYPL